MCFTQFSCLYFCLRLAIAVLERHRDIKVLLLSPLVTLFKTNYSELVIQWFPAVKHWCKKFQYRLMIGPINAFTADFLLMTLTVTIFCSCSIMI